MQLDDIDREQLAKRLEHIYQEYLNISKVKNVYLDVVIESEYNPFEDKDQVIKVDASKKSTEKPEGIVDPLIEQIEKMLERHSGHLHELLGGGRTIIPVTTWDTVAVTASILSLSVLLSPSLPCVGYGACEGGMG